MPHHTLCRDAQLRHQLPHAPHRVGKRFFVVAIRIDAHLHPNAVAVGDAVFAVSIPTVPGVAGTVVIHAQNLPVVHEKIRTGTPVPAVEIGKMAPRIGSYTRVPGVMHHDVPRLLLAPRDVIGYLHFLHPYIK